MSEAKPKRAPRRKAKADTPPQPDRETIANLMADLDAEDYQESMAGMIERATALLKQAAEVLADADVDSPTGRAELNALSILVTFFEKWADERGISGVLQTMKLMSEIITFRASLLRMEKGS